MPTINLTDKLGVDLEVELRDDSDLAKYVKDLKHLKFTELNFAELGNVTLDKVPLKSATSGITFDEPVDVGATGIKLKIGAGLSGHVQLFSAKDKQLFDPDVFGDAIKIQENQFFIGVATTASVTAGLTAKTGDLSFGLNIGSQTTLSSYRLIEKANDGTFPLFNDELKQAISGFTILGDLEDIATMAEGAVATVEGTGSLKLSGSFNLLSIVNPLASLDAPDPLGEIKVTAGVDLTIGASVQILGAYQIRVQKIGKNKFTLGYYKNRTTEFDVTVSASAGLSAPVGKVDLIEQVLKAVSQDPEADKAILAQGGLSDDQIGAIKKTLEAGLSRKLQIALNYEFADVTSSEAAFLYEVDAGALDQTGRDAIHDALDGDLTALSDANALPHGITIARTIFTEMRKEKHAVKFNLLGIYNYLSVATLMLKGKVMFEPAKGELVITDTATATKIAASTLNFAVDSAKLQKVMANSVMFTAIYRGTKLVIQPPELSLSHSYFELHEKTNKEQMKNNLDVLEALGLLGQTEKGELLNEAPKFGRTTLYAETTYDQNAVNALFFKNGVARTQADYESAGRDAIKLLVQVGEEDDARLLPATNDDLWRRMRAGGQAEFPNIPELKPFVGTLLPAIRSDYSAIVWWAESMSKMAPQIAAINQIFQANPKVDPNNNAFKILRAKLGESAREAVGKAVEEFGDPWGLIAMDQISGRTAGAHAQVAGPVFSLIKKR